ncbi:hypothetical protein [Halococcus hamelinensis]|uniref:hypothetical protein n=1 Tax=Halococcus hamelinensis TaxID=332168 RepID=UPI00135F139C|nr:hypothetical protein [Halococcus hamelinensis]
MALGEDPPTTNEECGKLRQRRRSGRSAAKSSLHGFVSRGGGPDTFLGHRLVRSRFVDVLGFDLAVAERVGNVGGVRPVEGVSNPFDEGQSSAIASRYTRYPGSSPPTDSRRFSTTSIPNESRSIERTPRQRTAIRTDSGSGRAPRSRSTTSSRSIPIVF